MTSHAFELQRFDACFGLRCCWTLAPLAARGRGLGSGWWRGLGFNVLRGSLGLLSSLSGHGDVVF